jgi:hypothetical protein
MGSIHHPNWDVCMWHRERLIEALERHNMQKVGNDVQTGVISHKLGSNYRLKAVANVPVAIAQSNHMTCMPFKHPLV